MLSYLCALYFWTMFLIANLLIFTWLVFVHYFYLIFRPEEHSQACHKVATLWGVTTMRMAPGWSYEIHGKENLPFGKPVMMVANHQSMADIWAIFLLGIQFRWLSKDTMFKFPIIGCAMRWAGYVPVRRGDKDSQLRALQKSREWIRRGISMVFFPEGTRSPDGKLREFKSGAFRIAMDEKVDVIPIVLQGTRDMMVKNSGIPKPAHLRIEVLPAMKPQEGETAEAYANRVHAIIAERLTNNLRSESLPPSKGQKEKRSAILTRGQISPTV